MHLAAGLWIDGRDMRLDKSVEIDIKNSLHRMMDEHVESMPKPKWPQSVFMPVTIDGPVTEYKEGDELIYWPN